MAVDAEKRRWIASTLSQEFVSGRLGPSHLEELEPSGFGAMPEFVAVGRIRSQGAEDLTVRVFLTLVAAMDRARDADRLWQAAADLWADEPRVFSPTEVAGMTESGLRSTLSEHGVSQRHQQDTAAWRRICESLLDPASPRAIRDAVLKGESSVWELRRGIARSSKAKPPWFPLLHGPKISEMWIRMLAEPGGASISGIDELRVAVDVQVRKVSEYLGVTDTGNPPLDEVSTAVRSEIQRAWHGACADAEGPPAIRSTCAALDPILWFFGKWGCTFCERDQQKRPISSVCRDCRFPERA